MFAIYSKSNIHNFFYSCIFDVQYTIVSDTGVNLFTSNLIRVEFKFNSFRVFLLISLFPWKYRFSLKNILSSLNPIPISSVNFTSI